MGKSDAQVQTNVTQGIRSIKNKTTDVLTTTEMNAPTTLMEIKGDQIEIT